MCHTRGKVTDWNEKLKFKNWLDMQYLDETRIGFLFDPFLKYLGAIFISLFVLFCRKFLLSCLDVVEHCNFNKIYNYFTVISYFLCLSSN